MKPIDPEELSAFLDGELPPPRAEAVRRALEEDPALREEYETLVALDSEWQAEALAARFHPQVRIPGTGVWQSIPLLVIMIALVAFRAILKILPPIPGGLLEVAALIVILGWGMQYLVALSDNPPIAKNGLSPS